MSVRPKVCVVGSYNTDLAVRTPRIPVRGETILGTGFVTGPGGKGGNQAVAAARLGADVTMLVKLGTDSFGDLAAQNLIGEGIRSEYILRSPESPTGVAFIIVDQHGENVIVVAPGANNTLSPDDIENARESIIHSDVLLIQLEIPIETVEAAAMMAHSAGVKVILNPAPGQKLSAQLLQNVDVLTPNETEAQIISGKPVENLDGARQAAYSMLGEGIGAVVMTLGDKGALVTTAASSQHVPGTVVEVIDTTGAGDSFSGALAVALAEGKDLIQAAQFANTAASIQVTRFGTAPAMPYRSEVQAKLEKI